MLKQIVKGQQQELKVKDQKVKEVWSPNQEVLSHGARTWAGKEINEKIP